MKILATFKTVTAIALIALTQTVSANNVEHYTLDVTKFSNVWQELHTNIGSEAEDPASKAHLRKALVSLVNNSLHQTHIAKADTFEQKFYLTWDNIHKIESLNKKYADKERRLRMVLASLVAKGLNVIKTEAYEREFRSLWTSIQQVKNMNSENSLKEKILRCDLASLVIQKNMNKQVVKFAKNNGTTFDDKFNSLWQTLHTTQKISKEVARKKMSSLVLTHLIHRG